MRHRTGRWAGGVAATILLLAAAIATRRPTLLAAAAIPLAYVAFGALSGTPDAAAAIEASREIEPTTAPPDRAVEVEVTLRNVGESLLPDVRAIDGVPDELAVVEGTPRYGGTLRPGESAVLRYTLGARRGTFDFEPVRVRTRSASAELAVTGSVEPAGDGRLVGRLDADAPPLYERAERRSGTLATDEPGRGLEFHSTREYRPGDPADRIDWRHYAKRGALATVNYRDHRSATAILVLDARAPSAAVPAPGWSSGLELSAYAATHALAELLRSGHEVGVAVIRDAGPEPGLEWVPPGGGRDHRARGMATLREALLEELGTAAEPAVPRQVEQVAARAPPGAQLLLFSPVLDDVPIRAMATWGAHDRLRSCFSPDVLATNTVSGQYAQVRRRTRLVRCQATGARTVDWRRGTPLPVALEYALSAARVDGVAGRRTARGGRG